MSDLQHQIDRVFDEFSGRWALALDMTETNDAVDVTAELPGVNPKEVDISVSGTALTIKGEKKSEKETKAKDDYCPEPSYGSFTHSIELPFEIDASRVEANFEAGMSAMWMTPYTTRPFLTAPSATGTSAPTGAKMIAASNVAGAASSDPLADAQPSERTGISASRSPGRVKARTRRL